MNFDEAKQYFLKLAQDSGLDDNSTKAVQQAIENEKFARAVADGFIRHDEYASGLDNLRKAEAKYQKWYQEEALPAYESNVASIDKLNRYRTLYGEIDGNPNPDTPTTLDPAEIDKRIEARLRQQEQTYVNLTKSIARMTTDYYNRFHEPLDIDAVEKVAVEKGLPPELAYKEYISPRLEEQRKTEIDAKIKAARDEGYRDALSKRGLPTDSTPKEFNPFFDRKDVKDTTPLAQERASHQAFLEGWNEWAENIAKSNQH